MTWFCTEFRCEQLLFLLMFDDFLRFSVFSLNVSQQYSKLIICIIAVYVALLIPQFPLIDYKKKDYETLNSKYFLNKKLTSEVKNYYEDLKEFSCNNNNNLKYLNISNDFAISYLCDEHITKFTINSSILFLKKFNLKEYKRLFINHKLNSNEVKSLLSKTYKSFQAVAAFRSTRVNFDVDPY